MSLTGCSEGSQTTLESVQQLQGDSLMGRGCLLRDRRALLVLNDALSAAG